MSKSVENVKALVHSFANFKEDAWFKVIKWLFKFALLWLILVPAYVLWNKTGQMSTFFDDLKIFIGGQNASSVAVPLAVSVYGACVAYFIAWFFSLTQWETKYRKSFFLPLEAKVEETLTFVRGKLDYLEPEQDEIKFERDADDVSKIFVIVPTLHYELNPHFGYQKIVANNLLKGIEYFYVLPDTAETMDNWNIYVGKLKSNIPSDKWNEAEARIHLLKEKPPVVAFSGSGMAIFTTNHNGLTVVQYLPDVNMNVRIATEQTGAAYARCLKIVEYIEHQIAAGSKQP